MGINDVQPTKLILRVAEELKGIKEIKAPDWAPFVKTGISRERAPLQRDWWHIRTASILRKMFIKGPIGVSKLRTLYGSLQNRGVRPEKFQISAGNHIRKILQQLEKAGLAKQAQKGSHKGRIVSQKGHSLLERMASEVMKAEGITLPKKEVKAKKTKPSAKKAKVKKPAEVKEKKTEVKTETAEKPEVEEKTKVKTEKPEVKTEVKAEEKSEVKETAEKPIEEKPEVKTEEKE